MSNISTGFDMSTLCTKCDGLSLKGNLPPKNINIKRQISWETIDVNTFNIKIFKVENKQPKKLERL